MSRKTTLAIAVCAVLVGMSMAGASFIHTTAIIPATTAAVIAQAITAQVSVGGNPVTGNPAAVIPPGITIHINGMVAQDVSNILPYKTFCDGSKRMWVAGSQRVDRTVTANPPAIWWEASWVPGLELHQPVPGFPDVITYPPLPLNGADFNCSGTRNGATVTVSP